MIKFSEELPICLLISSKPVLFMNNVSRTDAFKNSSFYGNHNSFVPHPCFSSKHTCRRQQGEFASTQGVGRDEAIFAYVIGDKGLKLFVRAITAAARRDLEMYTLRR